MFCAHAYSKAATMSGCRPVARDSRASAVCEWLEERHKFCTWLSTESLVTCSKPREALSKTPKIRLNRQHEAMEPGKGADRPGWRGQFFRRLRFSRVGRHYALLRARRLRCRYRLANAKLTHSRW
jgi:hypothetical protein